MFKLPKSDIPQSRGGLWVLIVAAVLLESIAAIQYLYSRAAIRDEAERRAKTELRRAELEIEKHTIEMETAAKTLAMLAEKNVNNPDSVYSATRLIVRAIRNTSSLAVAYVPDYFPRKGRYFEICSSRISEDSIYTRQIGSAQHDYTEMEWFQRGLTLDSCTWSEPYLDDSGSREMVVSCSCPVHDAEGRVVAVVCVDLALGYLHQLSDYLQLYQDSYYSIRSSSGLDIVARPDTVAGGKYEHFNEEIDATGWQISIIIPKDVIYADLKRVGLIVAMLMLLGMVLLMFILYRAAKNLTLAVNLTDRQERIESELSIARQIQMAMLPTRFPPFPDVPNLSAYGLVEPAKEVGGDLFDFYLRDNRLFFCIGDVSGKGVPAALIMAVTRSLFRSATSYLNSPSDIVTRMNDSLSNNNEQNMFVTLLLGILDLKTGELQYCNAGHNSPLIIAKEQQPENTIPGLKVEGLKLKVVNGELKIDAGQLHDENNEPADENAPWIVKSLSCLPNLPLGVLSGFEYQEQKTKLAVGDTLFLYTDGLSEAENIRHEQFGEARMEEQLQLTATDQPAAMVKAMQQAVGDFAGEAEQSDDLTLFAIRLLNTTQSDVKKGTECPDRGQHFALVMRNDIQQIPTLAEWIDSLNLPEAINMSINLALEEIVSNVMLYAYPDTQSGRVLVEAEKFADRIVFTISDSGVAFDPTEQPEPDLSLSVEERPIGGLGIHLVRQIMDEIQYERRQNKNQLTLVKRL